MSEPICIADYEFRARETLSRSSYEYFASGAGDEITLRENSEAFDSLRLRPRVLMPVADRDQSIDLLGHRVPSPILIAPMAFQRLAHPDGELATARGCAKAGAVYVASTVATSSLEEIAAASPGLKWFQLYVFKDKGITRSLVERAQAAGYHAIEMTADVPVMGRREADIRNHFSLPAEFPVKNLELAGHGRMDSDGKDSGPALYTRNLFDANLTWRDVEWLCSITKLPIVVKGILRGDDAVQAIEHGAAGVIVSNHGGRQLDSSLPTIRALPDVVNSIAGRCPVLIDGGIRKGVDIIKALALGANAVQVGRPILWALAVGGEAGVTHVLSLLREELDNAMALCGCASISQVTRDLVA